LIAAEDGMMQSRFVEQLQQDIHQIGCEAETVKADEPYRPYNITVLHGDELERIGVTTLLDALTLVPGVDVATDNMDNKKIVFRGSNPYAYGQSKLFIDGVEVNNKTFDSYSGFLSMPIEMIRRIEVTRGPGSMSDGVNAYAGSIRVYTRSDENGEGGSVWLRGGSDEYAGGGFVSRFSVGGFSFHVDGYYQQDDVTVSAGPDALATGLYGAANVGLSQTGEAPLWMKNALIGIRVDRGDLTLRGRYLYDRHGAAFGLNGALPEHDDENRYPFGYVEADYHPVFGSTTLHVQGGWKYSGFYDESRLLPSGFEGNVYYPDGFYAEEKGVLDTFYQTTWLVYDCSGNHRISGGYYLDYTRTRTITTKTTDRSDGVGTVDYSQTAPFIDPDANEHTWRLFFQDRYRYNEALTIQFGLNVERVSGISKTAFNPRVSAVYRYSVDDIIKAIYSRSTRTPSWQERFLINNTIRIGNPDLEMEEVNAYELTYIRRFAADAYAQATLFYLNNKKQINNINPEHIFLNGSKSDLYGVEISCKTPIGLSSTLYGSYSYLDGQYDGEPLANAAHHLLKGYWLYQFSERTDMALSGRYVGEKDRAPFDPREALDAYTTVDLAFGYHTRDYSIRVSIKNLFDSEVKYPSPSYGYPDDYPMPGRSGYVTFKMVF